MAVLGGARLMLALEAAGTPTGSPTAQDGRRARTNDHCRRSRPVSAVEEGRARPRLRCCLRLPEYPLWGEPGPGGVEEAAEAPGHPTPRQRYPAGYPARPAAAV